MAEKNLKSSARRLAKAGRYGDTQLVHMSMDEYMALQAMGKLTKNPDTGLPEAFNLGNILDPGGFVRDYGADILNPLGAFPEHTLFGQLGQIGADIPGSPGSLGAAIDRSDWSNPFSEGQNSFDIFAGGSAQSEDPTMRKIGRTVGSIFAGYGIGAAAGGAAGGAASGAESGAAAAGTGESAFAGEALGTGITAGAGGQTGLTAGTTASGIGGGATGSGIGAGAGSAATTAGISGAGALAPGFFSSEGVPFASGAFDSGVTSMQGSAGGEAGPGGPGGATFGAQPMSLFDRIINSAFGTPGTTFKTASNVLGMGSEIYNLLQQRKMQKMSREAFSPAKELQANPGLITSMPGYQFGLDEGRRAIERRGAASGSGGNEAIALARYTPEYAQQFYDREFARRAGLGQAEANANLQANYLANRGTAQSVGNIGFALARMFG